MTLLEAIDAAWGWVGIRPIDVVGENDFGNLIIKDSDGQYWRLCPEDCSCKVIAANRTELDQLSNDQEFLRDWHMSALVLLATQRCGPLSEGQKYCLKIPAVLGGTYERENIATATLLGLVGLSGDIARQIDGIPDGSKIELYMVD